ncbi:hypothetical protein GZH47_32155 (plasmid) [Paenibacillus rhizovicinus]|uniref:Uncharacterized protein n=1 Tax=Paenibacillus rhizovicinus TaxID=2704463 RepID=A0A6C0PAZ3_9BACL|nr:hypothetical protein [Paenibacillus rhizovicinus]QHW35541.1 hypothetical protein GZH47_32155 [Paenibacillus rhizovicinus]
MVRNEKWRWDQTRDILNPGNSEPCISTLFTIFDRILSDDSKSYYRADPLAVIEQYYDSEEVYENFIKDLAQKGATRNFSEKGIRNQLGRKIQVIQVLESYIMSNWLSLELSTQIEDLAKGTLAYHIGDEQQQEQIIKLFKLVANNIEQKIPEEEKKRIYGKTLFGLNKVISINQWASQNLDELLTDLNESVLLEKLWPAFLTHIENSTFSKFDKK